MLAHIFQKGHEYPEGQTKYGLFPIRKEVCAFWRVAPSSALTWYAMEQGNQELEIALSFNQYFLKDAADNRGESGTVLAVPVSPWPGFSPPADARTDV